MCFVSLVQWNPVNLTTNGLQNVGPIDRVLDTKMTVCMSCCSGQNKVAIILLVALTGCSLFHYSLKE